MGDKEKLEMITLYILGKTGYYENELKNSNDQMRPYIEGKLDMLKAIKIDVLDK